MPYAKDRITIPRRNKTGGRALARMYREGRLDQRSRLARDIAEIEGALIAERGGWDRCSVAERVLFEPIAFATVWLRLLNRHIAANGGFLDPTGQPIGCAKLYFVNLNSLTRAFTALGIRPPAIEAPLDLQTYIAAHMAAGNGSQAHQEPARDAIVAPSTIASQDTGDVPDSDVGEGVA